VVHPKIVYAARPASLPVNITVILCTHNRAESLAKTLESLAAQVLPPPLVWEVLVVDNHSTDRTRQVVEEFSLRYPGRFRYLFEPRQGKSYALNSGVRNANGEILAFTDDDLTFDPAWLQNLTARLDDNAWAAAGGRTRLAGAFSPPSWLGMTEPYDFGGSLAALFDLGDSPCELLRAPYGANMAIRKEMFKKYGFFRTDLGPGPNPDIIPRPNEDTEFGRRLIAAGERLRYEPDAVAYHPAPADRITKEYFLRWYFDLGRAGIREVGRGPAVSGIPRYYFRIPAGIVRTSLAGFHWLVELNPQRRFYYKAMVWKRMGETSEVYRQARDQDFRRSGKQSLVE
jgi:glucosyl-dolichyl phosphate glucuronosyltransferase